MSFSTVRNVFLASTFCLAAVMTVDADDFQNYNQHQGFYVTGNTLPPIAGGLYAGYLYANNVGVEAGVDGVWGFDLIGTVDVAVYHLDFKKIVPIGSRGEIFGKIGLGLIHGTENHGSDSSLFPEQSSESLGAAFGAGAGYDFTRALVGTVEINGIVYPKSQVLRGGIVCIPTLGITYYFSA